MNKTPSTVSAHCRAIPGAESLVGVPLIVLGELHGIDGPPKFAGDLACSLSAHGPLTLGLEIQQQEQPSIDTFLASAGEPADRAALLASPFWSGAWQDGRASVARVELLETIRRLRRDGAPIRVVAFDDRDDSVSQAGQEKGMAERIWAAHRQGQTTLVLVGNLHARTVPGSQWEPDMVWMSALLKQKEPRMLTFDNRYEAGSAWICLTEHSCGLQPLIGKGQGPRRVERFTTRSPHADDVGYDGVYQLGPVTASMPAKAATK